jgi:plastocyanin
VTLRPLVLAALAAFVVRPALAGDVAFKLKTAKGEPIADAVVSLIPLDAAAKAAPARSPGAQALEIIQKGQEFSPYVTPLPLGATVSFVNGEEKVDHQVYSLSAAKPFDLKLHHPGVSRPVTFDKSGVIAIGCNIHEWMLAYVVVLDTPWFAKTAAAGEAVVAGVAPGKYRAEIWHPRLAAVDKREITVSDGATLPVAATLTLKADRRIPRPVNAGGAGYK